MTKTNWFENVKTADELRQAFKKLVFKWHPDVTKKDTTAQMQEINNEYELLMKRLPKNEKDSRTSSDKEIHDGFREVLEQIVTLPDLDIEICGSWMWVGGQTYKVKDRLKEAAFKFSSKKKLWYWRAEENAVRSRKSVPMSEIRKAYGSEKVESLQTERLEA